MARRRVNRTGRRIARSAYGSVRRGGNKFMSALGFTKSGFKASNAVIVGGALYALIAPATATAGSSPIGIMMNSAGGSITTRATNAAAALGWTALGVNYLGGAGNPSTKGVAGLALGAGIGMKLVGHAINPMLRGSPIKL